MKKFLLFFLLIPLLSVGQKKESWELFVTLKKVASGIPDIDTTVYVSSNAKGFLKVVYHNVGYSRGWKRHFLVVNENNETLVDTSIQQLSGFVTMDIRKLYKLTQGKKFMLYTLAFPKDPKLQQSIRLRRIPLCTIEWKKA